MKVKFYEDARCSAKENPTPCKVPTVIEVEKVSFDDDTNLVIFWDKDFCQYESVIPENDHYAQDRILSQLLERGYADLTMEKNCRITKGMRMMKTKTKSKAVNA